MNRTYQKQINVHFASRIDYAIKNNKPIFIIKLETTGLEPETNEICGITVIRCEYVDGHFKMTDKMATLVKCDILIPDEASKVSGITNEILLQKGIEEDEMFDRFVSFLGEDAIVAGFCTKNFIYPFLQKFFDKYDADLPVKYAFDLQSMARSVLISKYEGYGARTIAHLLDTTYTPEGFVIILDTLYKLLPKGTMPVQKGFIRKSKYQSESYNNSYIYFLTTKGEVALNARTLYWEEEENGFFDTVDMDSLTDYLLNATRSTNLRDAVRKLEKVR